MRSSCGSPTARGATLVPPLALVVSAIRALALSVLALIFSASPGGRDRGPSTYAGWAVVLGLFGGTGTELERRALREAHPLRRMSAVALWLAIGDAIGATSAAPT